MRDLRDESLAMFLIVILIYLVTLPKIILSSYTFLIKEVMCREVPTCTSHKRIGTPIVTMLPCPLSTTRCDIKPICIVAIFNIVSYADIDGTRRLFFSS